MRTAIYKGFNVKLPLDVVWYCCLKRLFCCSVTHRHDHGLQHFGCSIPWQYRIKPPCCLTLSFPKIFPKYRRAFRFIGFRLNSRRGLCFGLVRMKSPPDFGHLTCSSICSTLFHNLLLRSACLEKQHPEQRNALQSTQNSQRWSVLTGHLCSYRTCSTYRPGCAWTVL